MTDLVYYRTAFGELLAVGIVLRDDYRRDDGTEALFVECLGAAPFEDQPFESGDPWDPSGQTTGVSVDRAYEIFDPYLAGEDLDDPADHEPHVVDPEDVTRRFDGDAEDYGVPAV